MQAIFEDEEQSESSMIFFDPNQEAQEYRMAIAARGERQNNDQLLELDLQLDISDIELDIFSEDDCIPVQNSCNKKKDTPLYDNAQDSTLISFD